MICLSEACKQLQCWWTNNINTSEGGEGVRGDGYIPKTRLVGDTLLTLTARPLLLYYCLSTHRRRENRCTNLISVEGERRTNTLCRVSTTGQSSLCRVMQTPPPPPPPPLRRQSPQRHGLDSLPGKTSQCRVMQTPSSRRHYRQRHGYYSTIGEKVNGLMQTPTSPRRHPPQRYGYY